MKTEDVRLINFHSDQNKVYFHLHNGKTVVRYMTPYEISNANRIGNTHGEEERIKEYVRLFNEKYSEPQKVEKVPLSESEKRMFMLLHEREVIGELPEEKERELEEVIEEDYDFETDKHNDANGVLPPKPTEEKEDLYRLIERMT